MTDEPLKTTAQRYAEQRKHLGNPFPEDFRENTLRIRRNLVAVAFVALVYYLGDLKIEGGSLFGTQFEAITPETVDWVLFLLLAYHLLHFFANSWEQLLEGRLRMTGLWREIDLSTVSMWDSDSHESANDPRQSTLFTWWKRYKGQLEQVDKLLAQLTEKMDHWEVQLHSDRENEPAYQQQLTQGAITDVRSQLKSWDTVFGNLTSMDIRLERFRKGVRNFTFFQTARWLILEWGGPLAIGVWAAYLAWPIESAG